VVGLLARTWRLEVVSGREPLGAFVEGRRPMVLSFWHNRSIAAVPFVRRWLVGRGVDVTLLASQSRDGELVTRIARGWRVRIVRGSATRGGRSAIRQIYRTIVRDGSSPIMIPDGPHGPIYEFKVGVAVIAQMAEAPILPLGFAAERAWRLRSWDRLIVPKPFSKVAIVVGEPRAVARDLGSDELETERQRLEALLDELTDRAEKSLGIV